MACVRAISVRSRFVAEVVEVNMDMWLFFDKLRLFGVSMQIPSQADHPSSTPTDVSC